MIFPSQVASQLEAKGSGTSRIVIKLYNGNPAILFYADDGDDSPDHLFEWSSVRDMMVRYNDNGAGHIYEYFGASQYMVTADVNGSRGFGIESADGGWLKSFSNSGLGSFEGWNAFSFAAGFGTPVVACQYKLFADGMVRLRGIADHTAAGTPADGTLVTTLPVGYRPAQYTLVPNSYDITGTPGRVQIDTDGTVRLYNAQNDFPCFDGIQFSVI